MKTYKTLGLDCTARMLLLEEVQVRWGGAFKNVNQEGAEELYQNEESDYADAEVALRNITQEAISKGVIYREATVSTLILDANGTCTSVRSNNSNLHAYYILLCTGAYIVKLPTETALGNEELQVNERLVAAGAVSGTASIAPEFYKELKNVPVFVNVLAHASSKHAYFLTHTAISSLSWYLI